MTCHKSQIKLVSWRRSVCSVGFQTCSNIVILCAKLSGIFPTPCRILCRDELSPGPAWSGVYTVGPSAVVTQYLVPPEEPFSARTWTSDHWYPRFLALGNLPRYAFESFQLCSEGLLNSNLRRLLQYRHWVNSNFPQSLFLSWTNTWIIHLAGCSCILRLQHYSEPTVCHQAVPLLH